jgi:O-succinylbenzoate synthase
MHPAWHDEPVKAEELELVVVRLPLVAPFATSFGVQRDRQALLVRVRSDLGEGWGECVAAEQPGYNDEYLAAARHVIVEHLAPLVGAAGDVTADAIGAALAPVPGHRMAKAALEMAVLDAELKAAGVPLSRHLGGERDAVDSGVSVGVDEGVDALLDAVGRYLDAGYRRVKVKIWPGFDVAPVRAVRKRFGDDLLLQVDANSAYRADDVEGLIALDAFELLLVEQPLAPDDLVGHARLAERMRTPICLDESIISVHALHAALELRACSIVNIKPGRVGGLLEARRIHDACRAAGVPVWCGGMLETGLGRAANVALASLPGFTLPGDLSASDRYFERDITEPFVLDDGRLPVPTGPGIGVEPIPSHLEAVTEHTETVRVT